MSDQERTAYQCPACGALWPHPSIRCGGVGSFNDHPVTGRMTGRPLQRVKVQVREVSTDE